MAMGAPAQAAFSLLALCLVCCRPGWALKASQSAQGPEIDFYSPEPDELVSWESVDPEASTTEERPSDGALSRNVDIDLFRHHAVNPEASTTEEMILDDTELTFAQHVDIELFRRRAVNGKLVITTVANNAYYPVLKNWLEYFDALNITGITSRWNVTVVCVDVKLYDTLRSQGYEPQLFQPILKNGTTDDFKGISYIRHYVASVLNMEGLSILYTDADAIWLRNPLPDMLDLIRLDGRGGVIASRGVFPERALNKWGATLCTGVLLYYGRLGASFWKDLNNIRNAVNDGHDQNYLNMLLETVGVEWDDGKTRLEFQNSTKADHGIIGNFGAHVTLLPHASYPRVCENLVHEDVKILHCIRDQVADRKVLKWSDIFSLPLPK